MVSAPAIHCSAICNFPFHSIKIDHSFVCGLGSDTGSRPIVGTIIDLAHAMRMEVVAEGVETEKQLAELIHLGCDRGQGPYLSAPLEESAIKENLFSSSGGEPEGKAEMAKGAFSHGNPGH